MDISQITDKLYLGALSCLNHEKKLMDLGIILIISVLEEDQSDGMTIPVCHIEIADSDSCNIYRYFELISSIIDSSNKVFIHCYAGVSRSATCIIAYLMLKNRWNLNNAFNYVKERRHVIQPNDGFLMQLLDLEYDIFSNYESQVYAHILFRERTRRIPISYKPFTLFGNLSKCSLRKIPQHVLLCLNPGDLVSKNEAFALGLENIIRMKLNITKKGYHFHIGRLHVKFILIIIPYLSLIRDLAEKGESLLLNDHIHWNNKGYVELYMTRITW